MSPIPLLHSDIPSAREDRNQADELNALFASSIGILAFSVIWLICVIGMILIAGYVFLKTEAEDRLHPEIAIKKAENGIFQTLAAISAKDGTFG
uniref:Uncharacterized protein n=1 Tax=Caenorhabditis japonica TaxID=281687 RepID=A0A8R1I7V4_CAEJA